MRTTDETIKSCFKKAGFTGDRAKYLFRLLSDEMQKEFTQRKSRIEIGAIEDLVINDGYRLEFDGYTITTPDSTTYNSDKQFVVVDAYDNCRGFNTIKGAMKYIEKNQ